MSTATPTTPTVEDRLAHIESLLGQLLQLASSQQAPKDWYTTTEVATILGRAQYTVREWCREGRVPAQQRRARRGNGLEWIISHEQLELLKAEKLRPVSA